MKDELQMYLESYCIRDIWIKKQINKKIKEVTQINTLSIASVKQQIKTIK